MTELAELQATIKRVRAERGFTVDPVQVLCLLVEEVGEVASEVKKTWSKNYSGLVVEDVAHELADVFVLLSALASSFDIDLDDAVRAKFLEADAARDWPSSRDAKD